MFTNKTFNKTGEKQESAETVFAVGSLVKEAGEYICVPCGRKQYFEKGAMFTSCFSCMANKKYEDDRFFQDLELWEKVKTA
ncbi:MAG: hypothetical protein HYT61_03555 [Candidatus Yanofskybacteria bacterium]|nr:hypothetical protein [Candidatus Yanofskybacteria bacterium]